MGLWGSTYVTHHLLLTCWSNFSAWKRVICSAAELCTSFNFNSRSSFLNLAKVIGNGMKWGHNSPVTWEQNILWHESHSSQAIICHTYAIVSQSAGGCMYNSIETAGMLDTYSYIGYPWLSKCSQNATTAWHFSSLSCVQASKLVFSTIHDHHTLFRANILLLRRKFPTPMGPDALS